MMKKVALWVLPLTVALALSGCSGSQESAPPTESATQQQPSATQEPTATAPAATTPAAPATEANSAAQLSGAEVLAVVNKLKSDPENAGAQVLADPELKAGATQIKEFAAQLNAKPAVCGAIAANDLSKILNDVNMAAMVVAPSATATSTSVSISSYSSADLVKDISVKQHASLKQCTNFKVTIQGREAKATTKALKADTNAETTLANLAVIELAGQKIETLSVYALQGANTVVVTATAPKNVDAALRHAEETINEALKLIAQK